MVALLPFRQSPAGDTRRAQPRIASAFYSPARAAVVIVDRLGYSIDIPAAEAPSFAQAIMNALALPAHAAALQAQLPDRPPAPNAAPNTGDDPDDARDPAPALPGAPVETEYRYGGSCHD